MTKDNEVKIRCVGRVWGTWRDHQCHDFAKVTRDGNPYCNLYDPVQIAERRKKEQEQWDKESKEREEKWSREKVINQYFEGISTIEIEQMIKDKKKV